MGYFLGRNAGSTIHHHIYLTTHWRASNMLTLHPFLTMEDNEAARGDKNREGTQKGLPVSTNHAELDETDSLLMIGHWYINDEEIILHSGRVKSVACHFRGDEDLFLYCSTFAVGVYYLECNRKHRPCPGITS